MTSPHDFQYNPEPLAISIPASGCLGLHPFQIVRLLDMIEADVKELVTLIVGLVSVKKRLEDDTTELLKAGGEPKEVRAELAVKHGAGILAWMRNTQGVCSKYGLDITYWPRQAGGYVHEPERYKTTLSEYINSVKHGIYEKLEQRKFIYMPSAEAEYYDQAELFGPEVCDKFPKANKEITAAGNCYAIGNYTACVFHLMRAVEYSGRRLVIALKVQGKLGKPLALCDWGDLMRALDEGVQSLSTGSRKNTHKKATFEFYNHAVAQFRNFKDAWRNNVSHTRTTFMPGVTKDIMDNTRQFMQHLATRLKE